MSSENPKRAECPVRKLDFINSPLSQASDTVAPQPRNHALAQQGAICALDMVIVNSRELVQEALRKPKVFSSSDLVEQGNVRPLIPLGIDPPDHKKYRRLLDPLFAPGQIDALEDDIVGRVNTFIDSFIDRGSCDFTAEFAELFPSSVFLGMMGLPWEELETLVGFRDGLLRAGTPQMSPASDRRSSARPGKRSTRTSTRSSTTALRSRATTSCRTSSRPRSMANISPGPRSSISAS